MAKSLSTFENHRCVRQIIETTKSCGRLTVKEAVDLLNLHRTTVEKMFRTAVGTGEVMRYGRLGLFRDSRAIIDFDLQRFTTRKLPACRELPPLSDSPVYNHVLTILGAIACQK